MEVKSEIINQNKKISLQRLAKDKKARSFASLSMTIFAISFFAVIAIRPTLLTIAKLTREIKEKRKANVELQDKIKTLIAAQDEYVKNSDNIFLLDQALPKRSEFPLFAFTLEQMALDTGIGIESFSFEKIFITKDGISKDDSAQYSKLGFSLTASGDYFKLKDFISNLETNKRIVKINKTSFVMTKNKTSQLSDPTLGEQLVTKIKLLVSGELFFEKGQKNEEAF